MHNVPHMQIELEQSLVTTFLPCHSSEPARKLQTPHGNTLVDLMLPEDQKQAAISSCTKEMNLSDRNACDVELLVVGCAAFDCGCLRSMLLITLKHSGFSPLTGFMNEDEYKSVVENMHMTVRNSCCGHA